MTKSVCDMKLSEAEKKYEEERKDMLRRNNMMHTSSSCYDDLRKVAEEAKKIIYK